MSYREPALFAKYHAAGLHEIDGLAEKLGWPEARLKRAQEDFSSDLFSKTVMQIAADDPVAAAEFYVEHRGSMTPADGVATLKSLLPFLRTGLVSDAVNVDGGRPGPSRFAASSLPDEAYTLLGVISGVESPGYNVINGGAQVGSLAVHPRKIGHGGTSTAAGKYQITAGTWDRVRAALKLPDFGPASQDVGAWWLAQQDYRTRTGRDLVADIHAGNYAAVRHGLAGTWEGVAKLSDADFAARMQSPANKPRVDGFMSGDNPDAQKFLLGRLPAGKPQSYVTSLHPQMQSRLAALFEAAPADIRDGLQIISGARSNARQAELFSAAVRKYGSVNAARKWVAPPGRSRHNSGMAVDIGYAGGGLGKAPPRVVNWLHENAGRFGLKFPLANENWHIELAETRGGALGERALPGGDGAGTAGSGSGTGGAHRAVSPSRHAFRSCLPASPRPMYPV
jgi:muramidase (phage lysozyme)